MFINHCTLKISLLCGGPSAERGISLNSARSVLDHLADDHTEIVPIYFDHRKQAYHISQAQLYSNTPSDFDFKLQETAKKLSKTALVKLLKKTDISFPVMHGQFGEDGQIQRFLERHKIPFIGSDSTACKKAFDKYEANEYIARQGFFTLPSVVLKIYHTDHKRILTKFFQEHKIKRAAVKPATGGSSIGVFSVNTVTEALKKIEYLFSKRTDTRVVVEPFCTGIEFTTIVLQNRFGMPVAILPTEIEAYYEEHQIFDYRKKYLPTNQVKYHCPPRFDNKTVERVQVQAEQLFVLLGMRDFARFDGWLLPDGNIWFSDFNPISGMEQNSFLFQQCARIGFSHADVMRYILKNACRREGIGESSEIGSLEPGATRKTPGSSLPDLSSRKPINVLFGGKTSERQVSLMSGTNAWLKLRKSKKYDPRPYLLDLNGNVWEVPYALTLNHTVEEVQENCEKAKAAEERLHFLVEKVQLRLALEPGEANAPFFLPRKMSLQKFLGESEFVFLGLHGGIGEDGTLQKMLTKRKIKYNGPDAEVSKICMDKWETTQMLTGLEQDGIYTAPKKSLPLKYFQKFTLGKYRIIWGNLQHELHSKTVIVKPQAEGCSSGIIRLHSAEELQTYITFLQKNTPIIPTNVFKYQNTIIEMPLEPVRKLLFEQFIETDGVKIVGNKLKWRNQKGWIELTVGVLGGANPDSRLRVLNPSLTVASGAVLSVEEKFQGGTGINITPPPSEIMSEKILKKVKQAIEVVAKKIGITGYSRIDIFAQVDTGDIIVIEVNTLPALTPSTVLFHQGLAEKEPLFPMELLEKLVESKGYEYSVR